MTMTQLCIQWYQAGNLDNYDTDYEAAQSLVGYVHDISGVWMSLEAAEAIVRDYRGISDDPRDYII